MYICVVKRLEMFAGVTQRVKGISPSETLRSVRGALSSFRKTDPCRGTLPLLSPIVGI